RRSAYRDAQATLEEALKMLEDLPNEVAEGSDGLRLRAFVLGELAEGLRVQGKKEEAAPLFVRALAEWRHAEEVAPDASVRREHLKERGRLNTGLATVLYNLGRKADAEKAASEAIAALQEALRDDRTSDTLLTQLSAALWLRGLILYERHDYALAVA